MQSVLIPLTLLLVLSLLLLAVLLIQYKGHHYNYFNYHYQHRRHYYVHYYHFIYMKSVLTNTSSYTKTLRVILVLERCTYVCIKMCLCMYYIAI